MRRLEHYRNPAAPEANSIVVAASTFVLDDLGRLLMVRRRDIDWYAIPGSAQKVGETIAATAIRGTREETGVHIKLTGLLGVYSDPGYIIDLRDGEVRQEFSVCFRAGLVGGSLGSGDENTEVQWVERSMLPELIIHPSIRLRIRHGFEECAESYYD